MPNTQEGPRPGPWIPVFNGAGGWIEGVCYFSKRAYLDGTVSRISATPEFYDFGVAMLAYMEECCNRDGQFSRADRRGYQLREALELALELARRRYEDRQDQRA